MTLLDTHIWVWWVSGLLGSKPTQLQLLQKHQSAGLAVSVISCWEVAKLVEVGRLQLTLPVMDWIRAALAQPNVALIDLTPEIAVASTMLPQPFHRDPADQIIVATARTLGLSLLTADQRLLAYTHVNLAR